MKHRRIGLILFICLLSVLAVATLFATAAVLLIASRAHFDSDKLTKTARNVQVYDNADALLTSSGGYVAIEDVSPDLIHAFVAVEDKRFYCHNGLDWRRIMGATVQNVKSHSMAQGASTISCQLIKNTHLSHEKTLSRKIQEAKLALELEKRYSKDEIMEMYLNVIYFGNGIYGVNNAAHRFFGKDAANLSLCECAAIAATTVNPAMYSPKLNADNNKNRRTLVLDLMLQQGYISQQAHDTAAKERLILKSDALDIYETYRINAVDEAARMTGLSPTALSHGYTIRTYCDAERQALAYEAVHRAYLSQQADSVALLADTNGHINAYCSSFSLRQNTIRRQIGSCIKPFVYAAAIENNVLLPATMLTDEPTVFGDYAPHNYHDIYYGSVSAQEALARSSNICAVKTLNYAGIDATCRLCMAVGLSLHPNDKTLALALGGLTVGNTFDEVVGAYACLANGGVYTPMRFVKEVRDANGTCVYRNTAQPRRAMRASTAYLVQSMLQQTVQIGTAKALAQLNIPIAAKTGTVQCGTANSDAWCAAFTPDCVALSWAGNLSMNADGMITVSGGGDTCRMTRHLLSTQQALTFDVPDDITTCEVDTYTLQQKGTLCAASPNTPAKYRQAILCRTYDNLPLSTVFETAPPCPDCFVSSDGTTVTVSVDGLPITQYSVWVDNGFGRILVDEKTGAFDAQYPFCAGWWHITPVLHGKTDLVGDDYCVLIL